MSNVEVGRLREIAAEARAAADYLSAEQLSDLDELERAAERIASAWSGSNLGYHANVYHRSLAAPPPGEHFSSEWGLMGSLAPGTYGDWAELDGAEVENGIRRHTAEFDARTAEAAAETARETFDRLRSRLDSALTVALRRIDDPYLRDLREKVAAIVALTTSQCVTAQLPHGRISSRDAVAVHGGLRPAPHQIVLADVVATKAPARALRELANFAELGAEHLELSTGEGGFRTVPAGNRVFIGHGRSALWRELKDFVQDRLALPWDEFNRVPVAGQATSSRLEAMLDEAAIALLVLTAEDEQSDGSVRARQNVVHEAGLFQGRLGFQRAIVLLEEGCDEFSNVHGLGQIRFPKDNIGAAFEEVRRVLEREGLIPEA